MCTRFAFCNGAGLDEFEADRVEFPASYNVAPTDQSLVVLRVNGRNQFRPMRWGLIPVWATDPKIGTRCLNARAETVFEKNSFRESILQRRCLVPADGFYEWKTIEGVKQPFFIHRSDGGTLAMAGIWDKWRSPDGWIESFSVLTSEPNREMSDVHNRMPVILEKEDWSRWVDPEPKKPEDLLDMLVPSADGTLIMHPVDRAVGNTRAEGEDLIKPIEQQASLWPIS